MATIQALPRYPSLNARKSLSPSQLSTLYQTVATSLQVYIGLEPTSNALSSTNVGPFLKSYFRDAAISTLEALIWQPEVTLTKQEKLIRSRSLSLVHKLVQHEPLQNLQLLMDVAVVSAEKNASRTRTIFEDAFKKSPTLHDKLKIDLLPSMVQIMSPQQSLGLYGIGKAARCTVSLLRTLPAEGLHVFANNSAFVLAIAWVYDEGLAAIATSYGGFPTNVQQVEADSWEHKFIQAKVDLIDAFHLLITRLLEDVAGASGRSLAVNCDSAFRVLFALLDLPSTASSASRTPFLDRSLLHDYQHSYDLAMTLSSVMQKISLDDVRGEALQSSLYALSSSSSRDKGVLRLLIRSSGAPSYERRGAASKGKVKAPPLPEESPPAIAAVDVELDSMVAQVLDILPEHSHDYVRALLAHTDYPFYRNGEKVIEALLEGTAPSPDEIAPSKLINPTKATQERRNIFDNADPITFDQVQVGKKSHDEKAILEDRSFMDQHKADILRRVEELHLEDIEFELEDEQGNAGGDIAYEDDLPAQVAVNGDGECTDDEEAEPEAMSPETVLELAYLADPGVFARDSQTRKSKARVDLRAQSGWDDNQIEGWKIMLERNPQKDRILAKHEFSGNRRDQIPTPARSGASTPDPGRGGRPSGGGGRGGRGGGGEGRGRGRGDGQSGSGDSKRERSFKERRGNRQRARGHDKKMRGAGLMS